MYKTKSEETKGKGFALPTAVATCFASLTKVTKGKDLAWVKLESKKELLEMWFKAPKSRIQGLRRDNQVK